MEVEVSDRMVSLLFKLARVPHFQKIRLRGLSYGLKKRLHLMYRQEPLDRIMIHTRKFLPEKINSFLKPEYSKYGWLKLIEPRKQ